MQNNIYFTRNIWRKKRESTL